MRTFNIQHSTSNIERPPFVVTPLAEGLRWSGGGGMIYQEKKDGVWAVREWRGALLVGEQMKSGQFWAFDVLRLADAWDISGAPLRDRLCALVCMSSQFEPGMALVPSGNGGEFLEAVLAHGGEGIVAKALDAPYGATWYKCKRVETFYCVVTEKHAGGKSSVRISQQGAGGREMGNMPGLHGEVTCDRGWLPLFGNKFDQCRVGSVLKVEGYGLTSAGKIREPRVCKDSPTSWLVRY